MSGGEGMKKNKHPVAARMKLIFSDVIAQTHPKIVLDDD